MKPIMILCQKDTFLTETTLNNYYSTICSEYAIKTTQGLLKCHSHTLWTPGLGYHKSYHTFDKDLSGWYKKSFSILSSSTVQVIADILKVTNGSIFFVFLYSPLTIYPFMELETVIFCGVIHIRNDKCFKFSLTCGC